MSTPHGFPSPAPSGAVSRIHEIDQLVRQFTQVEASGGEGTPSLGRSLAIDREHGSLAGLIARLPDRPGVLIAGHTAPGNAAAFRHFLAKFGRTDINLHAIDLHDMPAVYARLGLSCPPATFRVADATRLQGVFADDSVHVLVQHGLAHCVPPVAWPNLLAEAARVLAPTGFALMLFGEVDDLDTLPQLTPSTFEQETGAAWKPTSVDLFDYSLPDAVKQRLRGCVVNDAAASARVLITPQTGRFEFFRPWRDFERSLTTAGLVVTSRIETSGRDSNGLTCRRHHCLVQPAGR